MIIEYNTNSHDRLCVACNHVLTTLVIKTFISAAEVASSGDTRFPVLCDGLQTFHLHSSSVQHFPGIKGVTGLLGLRQLFFLFCFFNYKESQECRGTDTQIGLLLKDGNSHTDLSVS